MAARAGTLWGEGQGQILRLGQEKLQSVLVQVQLDPLLIQTAHTGTPSHDDPSHDDPSHDDSAHDDPSHDDDPSLCRTAYAGISSHDDNAPYDDPAHNDPSHNDPSHNDPACHLDPSFGRAANARVSTRDDTDATRHRQAAHRSARALYDSQRPHHIRETDSDGGAGPQISRRDTE